MKPHNRCENLKIFLRECFTCRDIEQRSSGRLQKIDVSGERICLFHFTPFTPTDTKGHETGG